MRAELTAVAQSLSQSLIDSDQTDWVPSRAVDASLAWGHAGTAATLAYGGAAGLAIPEAALDRAVSLCMESLIHAEPVPTFWTGYVGVAWLLSALVRLRVIEIPGDAFSSVDAAVLAWSAESSSRHHVGYSEGLVGLGVYALERQGAGAEILRSVLNRLEATATPLAGGAAWPRRPGVMRYVRRIMQDDDYVDMGMAHGQAGIVAFLAQACVHHDDSTAIRRLLKSATAPLLAVASWQRSIPWAIDLKTGPDAAIGQVAPRLLAWAYGELPVAYALVRAGHVLGDRSCIEAGARVGESAAGLLGRDASLRGYGLYDGAAGAAYLFRRLHELTGNAQFDLAAAECLRRVAASVAEPDSRTDETSGEFIVSKRTGLFFGSAGVVFGILAAAHASPLLSDRLLL